MDITFQCQQCNEKIVVANKRIAAARKFCNKCASERYANRNFQWRHPGQETDNEELPPMWESMAEHVRTFNDHHLGDGKLLEDTEKKMKSHRGR